MQEIRQRRENARWFLSGWPAAANAYLKDLPRENRGAEAARVADCLLNALRWRADGDKWPGVEESAQWATGVLREMYPADLKGPQARISIKPVDLLTIIALTTGEIRDFFRKGELQAEATRLRIARLKRLLTGVEQSGSNGVYAQFDQLEGLLEEAPLETIKLAVEEYELPPRTKIIQRGQIVLLNPVEVLYATSRKDNDRNNRHAPPLDPLLLLSALSDLTGKSAEHDERILLFFPHYIGYESTLRTFFENVLPSKLIAGQHASRLLREMAAKTKSVKLLEAIHSIDPAAVPAEKLDLVKVEQEKAKAAPARTSAESISVPGTRTAKPTDAEAAKTPATPERLYQGKPESEWLRVFKAETEPEAKLAAAKALATLADTLPAEQQLERVVEIGGTIFERRYGDQVWEFVTRFRGPAIGDPPTWSAFHVQLVNQTKKLPPKLLADRLSGELRDGSDARAAFACWLLGLQVSLFHADSAANDIIQQRLNVPLHGLDRSAYCLLLRAWAIKPDASDSERKAVGTELNNLLDLLNSAARTAARETLARFVVKVVSAKPSIALDCRKAAQFVLNDCLENPVEGWYRRFLSYNNPPDRGNSNDGANYNVMDFRSQRETAAWFLSDWPAATNNYLRSLPPEKRGQDAARVTELLLNVLRWRSDGDEWPGVPESVEWAANVLRESYQHDSSGPQANPFPSKPVDLLTIIILAGGEIPDFVRKDAINKDAATQQKLTKLKRLLAGEEKPERNNLYWQSESLMGLLDDAPYETKKSHQVARQPRSLRGCGIASRDVEPKAGNHWRTCPTHRSTASSDGACRDDGRKCIAG